jgi:hypothetical protein
MVSKLIIQSDITIEVKYIYIFFFESAKFIKHPTAQEVLEGARKKR